MGVFKAYDIRGRYGTDLTEDLAYDIGRALVAHLNVDNVLLGRDARVSSPALADAIGQGICDQGADLMNMGIVSTPMCYFGNSTLNASASVMVTASHNPPEDNGFKICRANAMPVGGDAGLYAMGEMIAAKSIPAPKGPKGTRGIVDVKDAYWEMVCSRSALSRKPKVVMDFANSVGTIEMKGVADLFDAVALFEELDGSFPNHSANPLNPKNLAWLQEKVLEEQAEFGVAFDGDADRAVFVDELGQIVRPDLVIALLALPYMRRGSQVPILFDVRSSWAVRDFIELESGLGIPWKVGHAFMKPQMAELGSPFGGELAGHYDFGDLNYAESSARVVVELANLLQSSGKTLSQLVAPLLVYGNSGEINLPLPAGTDASAILNHLKATFPGMQIELDGLTVEFSDWWFNARPSNTEPYLRLMVECMEPEQLPERIAQVKGAIAILGQARLRQNKRATTYA